jgi:hypothetical protein
MERRIYLMENQNMNERELSRMIHERTTDKIGYLISLTERHSVLESISDGAWLFRGIDEVEDIGEYREDIKQESERVLNEIKKCREDILNGESKHE